MALAEALHHSSGLRVMERAQHAAPRGQKTGTRAGVAGPAPVSEYVAPALAVAPFSTPAVTFVAPAPVVEYVAPTPAVTYAAPAPVVGYDAPAPSVTFAAPAPVIVYVAPAPVIEYIAPAPAVSVVAPSQQLRPACTADAVTTGVNLDAEFVVSASQVVGSLPHGEVFHHVSFVAPSQQLRPASTAAAVITGVNLDAEFVGPASQVVGSLPDGEVFHQVHQVPLAGGEIPENLSLAGARPGVLEDPAPQGAVTVGYVAAVAPSLAVVLVSDMMHDDATVQFLLQQSLLARAQEEEEARELEEVKELEDDVALKDGRLLVVLERDRTEAVRITRDSWTSLSSVEQAAVHWFLAKEKMKKRKEKRKKRRRRIRYRTGFLISCSS